MRRSVRRGQPLVALALILSGWVAVRAAILQAPFDLPERPPETAALARGKMNRSISPDAAIQRPVRHAAQLPAWMPPPAAPVIEQVTPAPLAPAILPPPAPVQAPVPVRIAAGHNLLLLAALSQLPLPPELRLAREPGAPTRFPYRAAPPQPRRWSGDAWLLWRRGSGGTTTAGLGPGSYGASQAGAVIRYRLAPGSAHRPALYLRATTALHAPRDEEVAIGFAARQLGRLPVVAMAELRATRLGGREVLRPAAALVSEFPPLNLPLGTRAEIYAQGGYVGGKGATPFVDGQLRLDRTLARAGRFELRAGGGVWGGAQRGAARLDVGPSVTLGLPLGSGGARVAADWRFRVAGDAAPKSGPAITLSAGF